MEGVTFEIGLIAVLVVANGGFAMAEIALVASRKARLRAMAEKGDAGARLAAELAQSPGRFLSTVQVGITLFGVVSGAVGGAKLAGAVAAPIKGLPLVGPHAEMIALVALSFLITTFTVLIGELVPKRLALAHPERIAAACAAPIHRLSLLVGPLVGGLSAASDFFLSLLGVRQTANPSVSADEVRVLIDEGLGAGVFRKEEKEMVEGVLGLDLQTAEDLMTPRTRIVWLSLDDPDEDNWRRIAGSGHSHFPVFAKSRDNIVGMVSVKALWANLSLAGLADLRSLLTPPIYVPTTMPAPALIAEFKKAGHHIALVVDEFGGLQGLVTLNDLMEAIVGDLPERGERGKPRVIRRDDGSWLADALLGIEDFKEAVGIEGELPEEDHVSTLGGFIIARLGQIPCEGQKTCWENYDFEVVDMDRQRVDKVLITRRALPSPGPPDASPEI